MTVGAYLSVLLAHC